jgi:hypothetical protein
MLKHFPFQCVFSRVARQAVGVALLRLKINLPTLPAKEKIQHYHENPKSHSVNTKFKLFSASDCPHCLESYAYMTG